MQRIGEGFNTRYQEQGEHITSVERLVYSDPLSQIKHARPELIDRRLRLIHAGRLLTDGTLLYSWITTLEERQRRATENGDAAETAGASTTWLHCSIGPKIEEGDEAEEGRLQVRFQSILWRAWLIRWAENRRHSCSPCEVLIVWQQQDFQNRISQISGGSSTVSPLPITLILISKQRRNVRCPPYLPCGQH